MAAGQEEGPPAALSTVLHESSLLCGQGQSLESPSPLDGTFQSTEQVPIQIWKVGVIRFSQGDETGSERVSSLP